METRIQKYLAARGLCSRRAAERLVAEGRVTVNGLAAAIGQKVSEGDDVRVDGAAPAAGRLVYVALHKPVGCVSTAREQFGRPCVADLVRLPERLYPVGRLDWDTSGLLIMTNDGALTHKLTHPRHGVDKTYIARVAEPPAEAEMAAFRAGLLIEGRVTAPAEIGLLKDGALRIVIHEGRNRQVRKMLAAIGRPALGLKRVATGRLALGDLPVGKWRHLTEEEVTYLKNL